MSWVYERNGKGCYASCGSVWLLSMLLFLSFVAHQKTCLCGIIYDHSKLSAYMLLDTSFLSARIFSSKI
jgi:hypothetical protein